MLAKSHSPTDTSGRACVSELFVALQFKGADLCSDCYGLHGLEVLGVA